MTAEHTTERPKDKFGIENSYSSEAVFALLTQDHRSRTLYFDNNWSDITERKYDPFSHLAVRVRTDLEYKFDQSVKTRSSKVVWFEGFLRVDNLYYLMKEGFPYSPVEKERERQFEEQSDLLWLERFFEAGIDFTISSEQEKPFIATPDTGPSIYLNRSLYYDYGRVFPSAQFQVPPAHMVEDNWEIGTYARFYKLMVPHEQSAETLTDVNNFESLEKHFLNRLEKVIRVTYKAQGKDLPPVKLEFKPEKNTQKEFIAACSFCGSNYFTAKNLECPHCGASSPQFLMEK